jgi:hypothetical protein
MGDYVAQDDIDTKSIPILPLDGAFNVMEGTHAFNVMGDIAPSERVSVHWSRFIEVDVPVCGSSFFLAMADQLTRLQIAEFSTKAFEVLFPPKVRTGRFMQQRVNPYLRTDRLVRCLAVRLIPSSVFFCHLMRNATRPSAL